MKLLSHLKCSIKGHIEGYESKCPFTMMTYTYCKNCNNIYKTRRSI